MKEKICKTLGYVNKIRDNVCSIDSSEFDEFYKNMASSDLIIPLAAGRSWGSTRIALSELAKSGHDLDIRTLGEPGFPARTMRGAAPIFEKKYKRPALFVNSGSGGTETPHFNAQEIADYIEETKTDKYSINVITSNPDSPIGKLGKNYGSVLELKGRNAQDIEINPDNGIMEDQFELGSLAVLQGVAQTMYEKPSKPMDRFSEIMDYEFPKIGKTIDNFVNSKMFPPLIDNLEGRSNVYVGGKFVAEEVAKINSTRIGHLKHMMGDEVYIVGKPTTPSPRANDIAIFTSESGGFPYPGQNPDRKASIVKWAEVFKNKSGAKIFSMVGREERTPLDEVSDYSFYIPDERKNGGPRWFYTYATFAQAPIQVYLAKRMIERGYDINSKTLRKQHAIAE
jgi:6-phospho-3-hexuloisomerase